MDNIDPESSCSQWPCDRESLRREKWLSVGKPPEQEEGGSRWQDYIQADEVIEEAVKAARSTGKEICTDDGNQYSYHPNPGRQDQPGRRQWDLAQQITQKKEAGEACRQRRTESDVQVPEFIGKCQDRLEKQPQYDQIPEDAFLGIRSEHQAQDGQNQIDTQEGIQKP